MNLETFRKGENRREKCVLGGGWVDVGGFILAIGRYEEAWDFTGQEGETKRRELEAANLRFRELVV